MADHTHIEWTDATWNPVTGCSVVSPGCTNCYAMRLAGTRLRDHPSRQGLTQETKAGPVWTGEVRFNEGWLDQPLRWKKPRRIFVCAHGDLFHESVPDAWIDQVFAVMALAPQHTFQVLTKRAARMRAYFSDPALMARLATRALRGFAAIDGHPDVKRFFYDHPDRMVFPLPNVWLGVSAEDQPRANERIGELMQTPAAIRFVSIEPMVGPVDMTALEVTVAAGGAHTGYRFVWTASAFTGRLRGAYETEAEAAERGFGQNIGTVDWVILGGESGPGARPMHADWARQVRAACADAGVPFFFKQWGAFSEFEAGAPNRTVEVGSDEADMILEFMGARRCAWVHPDGRVWRRPDDLPEGVPARLMVNVGKAAAGRLLDGVTHDALPIAGAGEPAHG